MKKLILIFLCFLVINCKGQQVKSFTILDSSTIILEEVIRQLHCRVIKGKDRVFKFGVKPDCNYSDVCAGSVFYFKISPDLDSFEYKDDELIRLSAVEESLDRKPYGNTFPIIKGIFKGKKIEEALWEFEIDVSWFKMKGQLK